MAFLEGQDDVRVFEAALGFVDEYQLDTLGASYGPTSLESRSSTGTAVEPEPHDASSIDVENDPVPEHEEAADQRENAGFDRSLLSHRVDPLDPRQRRTNPNRARDEAQFELVYLRDKVKELETKLRSLQLNSVSVEGVLVPAQLSPLTRMPQVWEDMASRQRCHREKAEQENARLKVMVERKQKMVIGLCQALQKRFIDQNAKYCHGVELDAVDQCSVEVVDFHGDIGEFQDLFRRLEAAHQEQDRVFAANGLASVHISTDIVQVREVDDKQIELFATVDCTGSP
ncbi:hypothetical protein ON010_g13393 [Phytophthora cinnamomi]|nr:hypothetical protein ON010_g13393 [Phytophthora cinnamomi]